MYKTEQGSEESSDNWPFTLTSAPLRGDEEEVKAGREERQQQEMMNDGEEEEEDGGLTEIH